MLAILKMNKGPELGIGSQDDVPTPASVASVGSALGDILSPVEMHRSRATVSGCAEDLDVVYEIAVCHNSCLFFANVAIIFDLAPLPAAGCGL